MNPTDPPASFVYVYNNLFISHSVDSPDAFKVMSSVLNSRKFIPFFTHNILDV